MEREKQIEAIKKQLEALPAGYVSKKNIRGKVYYYHQWSENGKKKSRYLKEAEAKTLSEQIARRRELSGQLKELMGKNGHHPGKEKNVPMYKTNIQTGEILASLVSQVRGLEKRDIYGRLTNYLYGANRTRVCAVYGLRRTGKTTMLFQAIADMSDEDFRKAAYVKMRTTDVMKDITDDLEQLYGAGYRYIFIDEVTLMEDFIDSAALFSDIYAMNGTPRQITVSLGLSKRFSVEDMEELYSGIRLACQQYHVDIIGGDTSSSLTGLAISITCIGDADKDKVVYRNGAKDTDLICVSGDLGAAYMGLQLLEREKTVLKGEKDIQPDFTGKEYLLERQLKPEARKDIIEKLAAANIIPTSMMDISDGLSSELMHICKQSNTGCRVYEEHIPIDYQTAVMAEEFNMNLTTCAMNGGEDYELLFTVPIADHEKVSQMEGIRLIGHITKPELGCALITRDGQEFELKAQGWNPLKEDK